ncbi:MAG: hypothetical protein AB1938_22580 [Myxococcota bacterium]
MRLALLLAVLSLSSCGSQSEDCGTSFCGCWTDATQGASGRVFDATSGAPLKGIAVSCLGSDAGLAVSDADGAYSFSRATKHSPGCGFEGCNELRFEDPAGAYRASFITFTGLLRQDGGMGLLK